MLKPLMLALSTALFATVAAAEMQVLEDGDLGELYGQAGGGVLDIGGQITYDAIVYTPPGGTAEVIIPGQTSSDGTVKPDSVTFSGQMFGNPKVMGLLDSLFMIMPIRYGIVDTNNDGIEDRGAFMFSFQPNVGMGTEYAPLQVELGDDTVNIKDQMYVTRQGILFFNAPLTEQPFQIPGLDGYDNQLVPKKLF